jgi:adenylate cyclase
MNKSETQIYEFGPFRLDANDRILLRGGKTVRLTEKVFNILLLLVQRSGHLVTKEELMEQVWPGNIVEENNLTVNMSALRKALREREQGEHYIETVPKRGYRFVAAVREIDNEVDLTQEKESEAFTTTKLGAPGMTTTLAVLPLLNVSDNPNLEYLSDGMTESIINSLSRLSQLKVLARNTIFRYKGQKVKAQKIGRELCVEAVLVGSINQIENTLIVSTELIDVADGSQVWGEQYNQNVSDIFAVQKNIVKRITETLRLKLSGEEREAIIKQYTDDFEAYQFYLKGRYFINKRTEEGIGKAIGYLEKAINIDPDYALAYAALASCYNLLAGYGVYPPNEIRPKIKAAAEKALDLDYSLAEAHLSLGHMKSFYEWDWAGGEAEFRLAIKLNPASAPAHHWYALWLRSKKRFNESFAELKLAQELDPVSLIISAAIAQNFSYMRQFDLAISQCLHILELDPDFYIARACLGMAYSEKGLFDEAIAELQRTLTDTNNKEAAALLGHIFAIAGRRDEARKILEELKEASLQGYVDPAFIAYILIGLDEKDEAFEYLEKAYHDRSGWLSVLHMFPAADKLQFDSRFTSLMQRIGHMV